MRCVFAAYNFDSTYCNTGKFTAQSQNRASFVRNREECVPRSERRESENFWGDKLFRTWEMDIPKEGVIVHLKDLGQTSKDRDADAVGTAFDLRVDAPGDVEIHKLQFGNHLVLRQFPLHTEGADGFANLNILFQFLFHERSLLFRVSGSMPKPIS